ncbi:MULTISPECIES: thiosulfate oxidation carrier protein SoxY [unclassified Methylophaga]|jgi:sulfur-oxidizing protein SoxY|uniref:thiosulfate oxidation carrier protein SoxY n=2 Tax=Methylophaga TaxID=40222 RepID=UPI000C8A9529|nr:MULTISPECIES: thiosulfate oxidation carrier protein SoxY [unclassified Methylophaga]MAK68081.1 transcriptional initiation protein Tat [Methylophaga sp.]MAY16856.1 transcriptional initiation protein Tat [Methylophaga sp.]MBN46703.1 transcriptional initiation protein Tat [Methylophaga sp.]HAO23828.1 transcriptional initiation protein Tat [Methylophaga sp.]HCD04525.1 transcriptional initiation protein Tat [Methylophaga sp.]|tara:strand:+ start:43140 stop:43628 length:489 start_codon:yes stop_codon:yes gene_type:complete
MNDNFDEQRRQLIKRSISASTLALVAASGLMLPRVLLAHWPQDAFNAETLEDAILTFLGEAEEVNEEAIQFTIGSPPTYAVNGATVPVEIHTSLENIQRVAFLVEKNPFPLAMALEPTSAVIFPFKTMLKVAEDSEIIAMIRADDKLYRTSRYVEIDIGGCA